MDHSRCQRSQYGKALAKNTAQIGGSCQRLAEWSAPSAASTIAAGGTTKRAHRHSLSLNSVPYAISAGVTTAPKISMMRETLRATHPPHPSARRSVVLVA